MANGRFSISHALGLAIFALAAFGASQAFAQNPNGGENVIRVGGFQIQFWNQGDGGGVGAVVPNGANVANANLGTWTLAERAAVIRAFQEASDKLNLPVNQGFNAPIIRVAKNNAGANFNARSSSQTTTVPRPGLPAYTRTNVYNRLVNNNFVARDASGVDAAIVITPGAGNVLNTDEMQQLPTGEFQLEPVILGELANVLGIEVGHTPHTDNINPLNNRINGFNTFQIAGFAGLPMSPNGADNTGLQYHNVSDVHPFALPFRNLTGWSPAEQAILDDMVDFFSGNSYNVGGGFGSAFYTDGTRIAGLGGFTSADDYSYGLFLAGDNQIVNIAGNFNQTGIFGTGIRYAGRDFAPVGNTVRVLAASTINVNGRGGIGVLGSSGARNRLLINGGVNATGVNGRGIVVDFGQFTIPNNVGPDSQINAFTMGADTFTDIDISGTLNATTNAIEIGDTATVQEINIMNGAMITGDILSNAFTGQGLVARPTITLGRLANAAGPNIGFASNAPDAAFTFNYAGDIGGTNPVDVNQFAGMTNQTGSWLVNDVIIQAGLFAVNGDVTANSVTINNGATLGGAGDVNSNVLVNGDLAAGNSIDELTINGNLTTTNTATFQVEAVPGGGNPIPGQHVDHTLVNGDAVVNGGTVNVMATPGAYTIGEVYTFLTANSVTVNGNLNYTNNLTLTPGQRSKLVIGGTTLSFAILRDAALINFARTPNEIAFAQYFDSISGSVDPRIIAIRDGLDSIADPNELRNAINELNGSIYATLPRLSLMRSSNQMRFLSQELGGVKFRPVVGRTFRRINGDYTVRGQTPVDAGGGELLGDGWTPCEGGAYMDHVAFNQGWVQGYGLGGNIQSDGNARGVNNHAGGSNFGAARWLNDNFRTGLWGAYGRSVVNQQGALQQVAAHNFLIGSFLHYQNGAGYWLLVQAGGIDQFQSTRSVNLGGVLNDTNRGSFAGGQAVSYLEKGWDFAYGNMQIRPFASTQYIYLGQEGFTERGGNTALTVSGVRENSLRANVGLNIVGNRTWNNGTRVMPFVRTTWQHEFLDTSNVVNSNFNFLQTPRFRATGINTGRDWGIVSSGFTIAPNDAFDVRFGYDILFNGLQTAHTGSGTITRSW